MSPSWFAMHLEINQAPAGNREERALSARPGDFTETIKKLLADRAGHECSMPYCRVRTVGPGAAATQSARVGQASHIYSAGLNGPRGRGGLSDAQLADPSNGIWTCELHGKDVDNNKGDAFPAGLLRSWKELHEARVKRMSTGAPAERWVEHARFTRTPLFEPDSLLHLGKVTVIGGTNRAGKTAICEWVRAARDKGLLDRWTGSLALHAINLEISFTSDKEHVLDMGIPARRRNDFMTGTRPLRNCRLPVLNSTEQTSLGDCHAGMSRKRDHTPIKRRHRPKNLLPSIPAVRLQAAGREGPFDGVRRPPRRT